MCRYLTNSDSKDIYFSWLAYPVHICMIYTLKPTSNYFGWVNCSRNKRTFQINVLNAFWVENTFPKLVRHNVSKTTSLSIFKNARLIWTASGSKRARDTSPTHHGQENTITDVQWRFRHTRKSRTNLRNQSFNALVSTGANGTFGSFCATLQYSRVRNFRRVVSLTSGIFNYSRCVVGRGFIKRCICRSAAFAKCAICIQIWHAVFSFGISVKVVHKSKDSSRCFTFLRWNWIHFTTRHDIFLLTLPEDIRVCLYWETVHSSLITSCITSTSLSNLS